MREGVFTIGEDRNLPTQIEMYATHMGEGRGNDILDSVRPCFILPYRDCRPSLWIDIGEVVDDDQKVLNYKDYTNPRPVVPKRRGLNAHGIYRR